ncbi:MAG: RND transporter [Gammaproteobacteria bacterium]|nr:RND transporter [Gammaproteobacteria bacterium]
MDHIPYTILIPLAIVLGLAPFNPEPHLWQKLKMLFSGELGRPVDIFDLFMHGTPLALLLFKFARQGAD